MSLIIQTKKKIRKIKQIRANSPDEFNKIIEFIKNPENFENCAICLGILTPNTSVHLSQTNTQESMNLTMG